MVERAHYSTEERRAVGLVRRLLDDVFHQGDAASLDDIVTAGCVLRSPLPGVSPDKHGFGRTVAAFHAALPGFDVIIEDMLVQGNAAVLRWTAHAAPDTDQPIELSGLVYGVVSPDDGRLREIWFAFDGVDRLERLMGATTWRAMARGRYERRRRHPTRSTGWGIPCRQEAIATGYTRLAAHGAARFFGRYAPAPSWEVS